MNPCIHDALLYLHTSITKHHRVFISASHSSLLLYKYRILCGSGEADFKISNTQIWFPCFFFFSRCHTLSIAVTFSIHLSGSVCRLRILFNGFLFITQHKENSTYSHIEWEWREQRICAEKLNSFHSFVLWFWVTRTRTLTQEHEDDLISM